MAREVEPKSLAVRELIDKHGPELTWNSNNPAKPSAKNLLKEMGFGENARSDAKKIDENSFNVKKATYLQIKKSGRKVKKSKKSTKVVAKKVKESSLDIDTSDIHSAIAFVKKSGGVEQLRAKQASVAEENEKLEEKIEENNQKIRLWEGYLASYEKIQQEVAAVPA